MIDFETANVDRSRDRRSHTGKLHPLASLRSIMKTGIRAVALAVFGLGLASLMLPRLSGRFTTEAHAREAAAPSPADPAVLQADVQELKDKAGDQAHAMVSVAYHFNNKWFVAEAENWPLAQFYWNETRSCSSGKRCRPAPPAPRPSSA
jgi:hypothetical protein